MSDELTENDLRLIQTHLTDSIEFYKIRVDLFKHLSTLSSGSIVVLVAFSKDLLKSGSNFFLIVALVGMIVSIVASAWTCFHTLGLMMKTKELLNGVADLNELLSIEKGNWINTVAVLSFVASMVSLVISIIQKLP